ncbi:MAG: hypothetical protein A2Y38_09480 [Spirochaetes bacterium GWB1_59_5]|nr:MAG: hypothetical protein A2Y38_09480 [Spirochaetes bacterium GWB1_59_5]
MTRVRDEILRLRRLGKSYPEIIKDLGCSKSVVSYHCSKLEGHSELVIDHNQKRQRPLNIPAEKEPILLWLLGADVRRTDVADALDLPYSEVLLFIKRQGFSANHRSLQGYERVKQRRKHLKMLAVAMKGGRCELCGYHRSLQGFDFHHQDPSEKDFALSAVTSISWSRVKAEIAKCQLLCATCHREQHERQWGLGLTPTWLL